jgi:hypothetical protein
VKKEDDFMKMMEKAVAKPQTPQPQKPSPPAPPAPPQQQATLSNPNYKLSSSDEDKVRRTIEPCWNIDPGMKNYGSLQVELKLTLNPDGSVRDVVIQDMGRYAQDSSFRAAADSARRALTNPRCNKLPLPLDQYTNWQTTYLRFDPKDILR